MYNYIYLLDTDANEHQIHTAEAKLSCDEKEINYKPTKMLIMTVMAGGDLTYPLNFLKNCLLLLSRFCCSKK